MIRANDLRAMNEGTVQCVEERLSTVDGDRVFLATKGPRIFAVKRHGHHRPHIVAGHGILLGCST